jgi:hypothetical protein
MVAVVGVGPEHRARAGGGELCAETQGATLA